ncbi:IucA/IucC family protein, partial [Bacillus velezensis]
MNTRSIQVLDYDDLDTAFKTIQEGRLLNDELKIKAFLEEHNPNLIAYFMNSLEKGRKGILKRLVGSMLRENILELTSGSHDLYVVDTIYALNVSAIDEFWQAVLQKLQSFGLDKGRTYKMYPLHQNECIVIPISKTYA